MSAIVFGAPTRARSDGPAARRAIVIYPKGKTQQRAAQDLAGSDADAIIADDRFAHREGSVTAEGGIAYAFDGSSAENAAPIDFVKAAIDAILGKTPGRYTHPEKHLYGVVDDKLVAFADAPYAPQPTKRRKPAAKNAAQADDGGPDKEALRQAANAISMRDLVQAGALRSGQHAVVFASDPTVTPDARKAVKHGGAVPGAVPGLYRRMAEVDANGEFREYPAGAQTRRFEKISQFSKESIIDMRREIAPRIEAVNAAIAAHNATASPEDAKKLFKSDAEPSSAPGWTRVFFVTPQNTLLSADKIRLEMAARRLQGGAAAASAPEEDDLAEEDAPEEDDLPEEGAPANAAAEDVAPEEDDLEEEEDTEAALVFHAPASVIDGGLQPNESARRPYPVGGVHSRDAHAHFLALASHSDAMEQDDLASASPPYRGSTQGDVADMWRRQRSQSREPASSPASSPASMSEDPPASPEDDAYADVPAWNPTYESRVHAPTAEDGVDQAQFERVRAKAYGGEPQGAAMLM